MHIMTGGVRREADPAGPDRGRYGFSYAVTKIGKTTIFFYTPLYHLNHTLNINTTTTYLFRADEGGRTLRYQREKNMVLKRV